MDNPWLVNAAENGKKACFQRKFWNFLEKSG